MKGWEADIAKTAQSTEDKAWQKKVDEADAKSAKLTTDLNAALAQIDQQTTTKITTVHTEAAPHQEKIANALKTVFASPVCTVPDGVLNDRNAIRSAYIAPTNSGAGNSGSDGNASGPTAPAG